jgi:hypothetical protein
MITFLIGPNAECAHNPIFVMTYLPSQFSNFSTLVVSTWPLLTTCAKEEWCAGVQFVVGRSCERCGNEWKAISTVFDSVLLEWSVYERIDMLKHGQSNKEWWGTYLYWVLRVTLNICVQSFSTSSWPQSVKWQTKCRLVTILPMQSSITDFTTVSLCMVSSRVACGTA